MESEDDAKFLERHAQNWDKTDPEYAAMLRKRAKKRRRKAKLNDQMGN